MASFDFDLIVIGGGAAGEKGAVQAAFFGKKVALIEKEPHLGGAMVNTGTLPSKTLRETALYLSGFRQRGLHGALLTRGPTTDDDQVEFVHVARERSAVERRGDAKSPHPGWRRVPTFCTYGS